MGRYIDIGAIVQVIGGIYQNPALLDNENYNFSEQDFTEEFHKIIFGSIYNLHVLGAAAIDSSTIEDYLEQRPTKLAVYKTNRGAEYLEKLKTTTQVAAFDYYYKRMKKMTLFRMYQEQVGLNLSWLYDVEFELLKEHTSCFICTGPQAFDIAVRLKYAGIDESKIKIHKDIYESRDDINKSNGPIYAILNFDYINDFNTIMEGLKNEN